MASNEQSSVSVSDVSLQVNEQNHCLEVGHHWTSLEVVRGRPSRKSLYLNAREREAGDFASASVAAVFSLDGPTVKQAGVVMGGVATVLYRAGRWKSI